MRPLRVRRARWLDEFTLQRLRMRQPEPAFWLLPVGRAAPASFLDHDNSRCAGRPAGRQARWGSLSWTGLPLARSCLQQSGAWCRMCRFGRWRCSGRQRRAGGDGRAGWGGGLTTITGEAHLEKAFRIRESVGFAGQTARRCDARCQCRFAALGHPHARSFCR